MKAPAIRPDGSCSACTGGWMCQYHQQQTAREWNAKQSMLAEAAAGQRESELQRIQARYELESDEGGTAREKAERIIRRQTR